MKCNEFGKHLLDAGDLDPVYTALWNAELPPHKLKRWLLAYWCFYHMGTASWIADRATGYWERFYEAANSKAYPRCSERRHFRAANAVNSVIYLENEGLANLFGPLIDPKIQSAAEIMRKVRKWNGFGPWISFKVADMLERLDLCRVRFNVADVYLFESPLEGAKLLAEERGAEVSQSQLPSWAVETLLKDFRGYKAPPRFERSLNAQEIETILCKWKSFKGGHYEIGEDVESCQKSLQSFSRVNTSKQLLRAGLQGGLW